LAVKHTKGVPHRQPAATQALGEQARMRYSATYQFFGAK
jgi:hypothetical protein